MGVLGGMYVWKVENGEIDYGQNHNNYLGLAFNIFPINCFRTIDHKSITEKGENGWKTKVDFCMGLCVITMTGLVVMTYHHIYYGIYSQWSMRLVVLNGKSLLKSITNYVLPHCFVIILMGLCLDRNCSYASRILSIWLLRWIGKMSFHLYVIHGPILQFIHLALNRHLISNEYDTLLFILTPVLAAQIVRKIFDEPIQLLFKTFC